MNLYNKNNTVCAVQLPEMCLINCEPEIAMGTILTFLIETVIVVIAVIGLICFAVKYYKQRKRDRRISPRDKDKTKLIGDEEKISI